MPAKKLVLGAIGVVAFVVDPLYACQSLGHEIVQPYEYGEADMRATVEGSWVIDVPATATAPAQHLAISIRQGGRATIDTFNASLVRQASACGKRSFIRSASACADISTMPLAVHVVAGSDGAGELEVMGTTLEYGEVTLAIGDAKIEASLAHGGVAPEVTYVATSDKLARTGTMVRSTR